MGSAPDNRTVFVNFTTSFSTSFEFGSLTTLGASSSPSQFLHLKTCLFFTAFSQGVGDTHLLCIHLLQVVHSIVGKFILIFCWHIPQSDKNGIYVTVSILEEF